MNPIRILLIGGGHAHIEVVRRFQSLFSGLAVEMMLLNPEPMAVYSGMIPGVVAGHYRTEDCLINLPVLCECHGVTWNPGRFKALETDAQRVLLESGESLTFDMLSLDIGSVPATEPVQGAVHAVTVKPAHQFLRHWEAFLEQVDRTKPRTVSVVGGGVAGVELGLAMAHRIQTTQGERPWHWRLIAGGGLLEGHNPMVRRRAKQALDAAGIHCLTHVEVTAIQADGLQLADGQRLHSDFTLLCTSAVPPQSLSGCGLPLSDQGYIRVDEDLRVKSMHNVFAVGDIAHFPRPLPKAGVYAVRQGPVLAQNLLRLVRGEPLQPFHPQRRYLKLISLGEKKALASRGWLYCSGAWVWRWKNRIDVGFMEQYQR